MSKHILAPIDGSELSEAIFPWLRLLAGKEEVQIELFKTYYPPAPIHLLPELTLPPMETLSGESIAEQTLDYLERRKAQLEDLQVTTRAACGEPADMILERAAHHDMVVMASHGRGGLGRWLLGSVALKVAKGCPAPLFVVGGRTLTAHPDESPELKRIMVPLDGSPISEQALGPAIALAKIHEAEVVLYRSLLLTDAQLGSFVMVGARDLELQSAREYLEEIESRYQDIKIRSVVRELPPARGIIDTIESEDVDLVVMSSHGYSGLTHWLLGSVTEGVLQRATCPVMVVRPAHEEGSEASA